MRYLSGALPDLAAPGKPSSVMVTQDLAAGQAIGLLGGSFNPSHEGHLAISAAALRLLGLRSVWWLVSPQNPLKAPDSYLPYAQRWAHAHALTRTVSWLHLCDLERRWGTQFSADTLRMVCTRYRRTRFVWIMGADSFAGFHRWRAWREIAERIPIAVISRPGYGQGALTGVAARTLARWRVPAAQATRLTTTSGPAWTYLPAVHNPISATALRTSTQGL